MGCGKKGVGIAGLAGWWVCGEAGGTHKDVKRNEHHTERKPADR